MKVHVYLPSGNSCSIALDTGESRVCELKAEAQRLLNRRFLRLAFGVYIK